MVAGLTQAEQAASPLFGFPKGLRAALHIHLPLERCKNPRTGRGFLRFYSCQGNLPFFFIIQSLSPKLRKLIHQTDELSKQCTGMQVHVCLNYGGRDEILRAARALAQDCLEGRLSPEDIGEKELEGRMYCHDVPPPDLLVRPGGEMRISNFLLWECAYSEFYFTDTLWPDFGREEIYKAIAEFQKRNRRYGGLSR